MRIGTWNVEHARGTVPNELRRQVLESLDADIWVLTETRDELRPSPDHALTPSAPLPSGLLDGSDATDRWVSIWSRFPRLGRVATADPTRTTAARFATNRDGAELIVFGTVLPWHADKDDDDKNWDKFHRVVAAQAEEWAAIRAEHPHAALVVAGDFNHSLSGPGYYWTKQGRAELRAAFEGAGLQCLTGAWPLAPLVEAPIDHIAVAPPLDARLEVAEVTAWTNRNGDDVVLSDHSGVLVECRTIPIEGWLAEG
jgi:exonuclease III